MFLIRFENGAESFQCGQMGLSHLPSHSCPLDLCPHPLLHPYLFHTRYPSLSPRRVQKSTGEARGKPHETIGFFLPPTRRVNVHPRLGRHAVNLYSFYSLDLSKQSLGDNPPCPYPIVYPFPLHRTVAHLLFHYNPTLLQHTKVEDINRQCTSIIPNQRILPSFTMSLRQS